MKSRMVIGCAIILLGAIIAFGFMNDSASEPSVEVYESAGNSFQKLEQLVIMENEATKDNDDGDLTTTKHTPDYTKMFPDLYTEYSTSQEDEDKKIAYLTFDDGPSENTFDILDILQEKDIKATFFIVGREIDEEGEDVLKRMVNEGHTIGIHTYSHMCNEIYCSVERFLDDFNNVYQRIYEVTGERVNIYRFPWGSNNKYNKGIKDALIDEMERRGFSCYDWNVSADDSIGRPTPYSILHNIKKDMKRDDHPIILMHDSKINDLTVKMLPDIIEMIGDMGFGFDTLENREPYQFPW